MFEAHSVSITEDEGNWVVGLADSLRAPSHYLLIQRSKQSDEHDRALGMDKLHFEFNDQSRASTAGLTLSV